MKCDSALVGVYEVAKIVKRAIKSNLHADKAMKQQRSNHGK